MSKLSQLAEKTQKLEKEIADHAKDALGEAFTELFTNNPTVMAIRWRQYTPYFNDGEACEFGVGEFEFRETPLTNDAKEADEGDDGWMDTYSAKRGSAKAVSELHALCSEKVMRAAFDDHVTVFATRDGFIVEEYEHD